MDVLSRPARYCMTHVMGIDPALTGGVLVSRLPQGAKI
jgi:hypothetical protein